MFRKPPPAYWPWAVLLWVMTGVVAGSAQSHADGLRPAKSADDLTLKAELVKTGLYLISGGGANSLLRLSANGQILVDGKLPGSYRALMSQVRKISKLSDLPLRALIVTDHHEAHTGNNAQFLAEGVQIIAHENVKRHLARFTPRGETVALPTVTYAQDYRLRLGGVEVQLLHFGNAHTSGDAVVYFPNLKVVAVGDLFTPDTPDPDFAAGGSLVGWGPVLADILKLDFDVVVPAMGPVVARADVETFKSKIDTLVARATSVVKKDVPKNQLMAQLNTDDLGWRFDFTGDRLDRFYTELSRAK